MWVKWTPEYLNLHRSNKKRDIFQQQPEEITTLAFPSLSFKSLKKGLDFHHQ
jgi:hypothetical protein